MNDNLIDQWSAMEEEKVKFLATLSTFSQDQLHYRPEGAWNALMVADHIITSEFGTFQYLMKKTQAAAHEIPQADEASHGNAAKLNAALQSDKKWQAPPVLPDPTDERSLEELSQRWSSLRRKLHDFLEQLDDAYIDKQVFKHPLAGRLDMPQTLAFMANHIVHHQHQLRRLLGRES